MDQSPAGTTRTVLQGADTPEASLFLNVPTTAATPYVIRVHRHRHGAQHGVVGVHDLHDDGIE